MRASAAILASAMAWSCGRTDNAPSTASTGATGAAPPPAAPVVDPIAKGIPHGGMIAEIAITEEADAALTVDTILGVRLWPTLDGTRPPVPVSAHAPDKLALAHSGRDLLAAILDQAGGVRVLRLGLDGSIRGRASLLGEYEQVVALANGVVVRTKDHAIEWYAPDGTPRGRVMADTGQQVITLFARHGRAAALVANARNGYGTIVRWLGLGTSLEWGDHFDLLMGVLEDKIALAPSGKRVAFVDKGSELHVFDVTPAFNTPTMREIAGTKLTNVIAKTLGFLDEDTVALASDAAINVWSAAPPSNDPWAVASGTSTMPLPPQAHFIEGSAIGDGLAVSGYGSALALSTLASVHYLGWKSLGGSNIAQAGADLVLMLSGSHFAWLDDKLQSQGDLEMRPHDTGPWVYGTPIDENHVIMHTQTEGKYRVELVDVELDREQQPDARLDLGLFDTVDRVEYSPDTKLLGLAQRGMIERYRVDLEHDTATKESPLHVRGSLVSMRLLDPAKADGTVAITVGWETEYDDATTLTIYREDASKKVFATKIKPFGGQVLSIDPTGTMYLLGGSSPNELRVQKGKTVVAKVALPDNATPVAVTGDGSRIAYLAKNELVMLDRTGTQLWRQPMWGAVQLVFARDATKLAVRASGGIVVLDAATGVRTAMECGWDFGILTDAPPVIPSGTPPVCEDPTLP